MPRTSLRLLEHLNKIEDPTRLVGWLVTTTRRECLRVLKRSGRERLIVDEDDSLDLVDDADPVETRLITNERNAALWRAFVRLPERCQRLLRIAVAMPKAYDEVSKAMDMPVGSIGPTRARCLGRLRELLAAAGLTGFDDPAGAGGRP
jgi:RNA polymerase sigma factor (sigma-70 family)